MRKDREQRSASEREIDDFLSQFESPVEDSSADISSYLEETGSNNGGNFRWDDFGEKSNPATAKSIDEDLFATDTRPKPAREISVERFRYNEPSNSAEIKEERPIKAMIKKEKSAVRSLKAGKNDKPRKDKKNGTGKNGIVSKLFLKENPNFDPSQPETYMQAGKKIKNKPTKVSIGKIILDCIALGCIMVACFLLYCTVVVAMAPKINPTDIYATIDQSSIVYDDEGKQVDAVFYTENRKIVKYENMPEDLINSFVAIEDKTFWKHHGFNWTRMIGAVLSSVFGGGQISGTSTITQQLARNVYLADIKSVRSIRRKVMEMYYASRIEAKLSKEEIVEAYLNTIYLGYGCYGVNAAAKVYFSKNVKDLDLLECAALAALPQAPDTYALIQLGNSETISDTATNIIMTDPDIYVANDTAKGRRDLTLALMKDQGYITEEQYNKVAGTDLIDFINPTITSGNGVNSYFHEYLVDTIVEDLMAQYNLDYSEAERMVYTQGLKIYSTLDSTAQKVITKEFADQDNYPSVSGIYNRDSKGNILASNGDIKLYNYDTYFNDKGNFVLSGDEVAVNSDGSVTIKRGNRLFIYETTVNGETDYSLEFKPISIIDDGKFYAIQGGYINIPSNYKSLDNNDNLVISADFIKDYPEYIKIKDDKVILYKTCFSLGQKTIQPQSAMVVVGVGTGEVKAMVGGRTTKGERLLNRALNGRQPGSSIKPLSVYGAALQKSFELCAAGKTWDLVDYGVDKQGTKGYGSYITTYSSVADEKMKMEGRIWPINHERTYSGTKTFMDAIQWSINTCAVKIQLQVGNEFSANMLKKFGLSTLVTDESNEYNDMNPAALALGGLCNGVIPLEMALAYSAFPAGGKVNTPICYTKVVDRNGEVILEGKSEQSEVMNEGVAWIMQEVLKTVVTRGGGRNANISGVQVGGKTGTTNDNFDIWYDGFTPTYAASLWIGADNNLALSASAGGPAALLWGRIMNQIPKAKEGSYKSQPSNVISLHGCYFTQGTQVGLDQYKAEDEKKMKAAVAKVEAYCLENDVTIAEACELFDISYEDYVEYGGKYKANQKIYVPPEDPVTPDEPDPENPDKPDQPDQPDPPDPPEQPDNPGEGGQQG